MTGSAHTALGPYWAGVLGKQEFTAFQASPRGGIVRVRLDGDRVKLGGQAVTVMTTGMGAVQTCGVTGVPGTWMACEPCTEEQQPDRPAAEKLKLIASTAKVTSQKVTWRP